MIPHIVDQQKLWNVELKKSKVIRLYPKEIQNFVAYWKCWCFYNVRTVTWWNKLKIRCASAGSKIKTIEALTVNLIQVTTHYQGAIKTLLPSCFIIKKEDKNYQICDQKEKVGVERAFRWRVVAYQILFGETLTPVWTRGPPLHPLHYILFHLIAFGLSYII